jgi:hypothetical protein
MDVRFPANVRRTSGVQTPGYLQKVVQREDSMNDTAVVWWIENKNIIEKEVPMKDFVELNPEYKYLLRKPEAKVKFNTPQMRRLQECDDCPLEFQ